MVVGRLWTSYGASAPDVVVPDGITVLQQVRSLNPDQPVIMLTGHERQRRNTWYTRYA
ncbi:MAG TPA: hypothetical protein VLL06_02065 [Nitrospiraceae bacterium]|nr:hypothetical protein [Nitrospiraceae bacterium]